jgi:hypothetical protein
LEFPLPQVSSFAIAFVTRSAFPSSTKRRSSNEPTKPDPASEKEPGSMFLNRYSPQLPEAYLTAYFLMKRFNASRDPSASGDAKYEEVFHVL